jgi:hypothetical protein
MTKQFLDSADIVARFQHMGGERPPGIWPSHPRADLARSGETYDTPLFW